VETGRHLFIVSRQNLHLYEYLAHTFASELDVEVIVDRREGARRGGPDRRAAARGDRRLTERRAAQQASEDLRTLGYAFVRHA